MPGREKPKDKPLGESLGWRRLETRYPFRNRWFTLREDRVAIEGNGEIEFSYHESEGAVVVVPVTAGGEVVMARQYRYTVDRWCLEVPAGGLHDVGDMPLEEVARKELEEEVGASCEEILSIASFYSSDGQSDQECHVFLALGARLDREREPEHTELIEVVNLPAREVFNMARRGEIKDGICALALLLCQEKAEEYLRHLPGGSSL
jgi:ADP-ribose pyrophosphatase